MYIAPKTRLLYIESTKKDATIYIAKGGTICIPRDPNLRSRSSQKGSYYIYSTKKEATIYIAPKGGYHIHSTKRKLLYI